MNEQPIKETIGLALEKLLLLSGKARTLYDLIYDYCTYSSDPQYQTLHKFRNLINKMEGTDKMLLMEYFNNDPAIHWNGMPCQPWLYYKDPY